MTDEFSNALCHFDVSLLIDSRSGVKKKKKKFPINFNVMFVVVNHTNTILLILY